MFHRNPVVTRSIRRENHMSDDVILTITEVASLLRVSKAAVYAWTSGRGRGRLGGNPFPVLRLGTSIRFVRSDVMAWIDRQKETA
jgi:excisionase family DNA binding protein